MTLSQLREFVGRPGSAMLINLQSYGYAKKCIYINIMVTRLVHKSCVLYTKKSAN